MKSFHSILLLLTISLSLALSACEFSVSTANIESAVMAFDEKGERPTKTYSPTDVLHCVVDLANAPEGTSVKAEWIAVEAEGAPPKYTIDSYETVSDSALLNFDFSKDTPWPTGKYKVNLYLNDELDRSVEFEIR
jgi:hypothetical protein